jgi:integrase
VTNVPKLTKTIAEAAPTKEAAYFVWCDALPGFGLRVLPTGKRTFYVDYRNGAGDRKRMKIGNLGLMTVEEARKLAITHLGAVNVGGDPIEERQAQKQAITIGELCDMYLKQSANGTLLGRRGKPKKELSLAADETAIRVHIKPLLGKVRADALKRRDVYAFISDVTDGETATVNSTGKLRGKSIVQGGPSAALRAVNILSGVMSFALDREMIEVNPVLGVRKPAPGKRDRRLSPEEYQRLGAALKDAESERWSDQGIWACKLLCLTGARLEEIVGLKWSEVDFDRKCLSLADSKTGRSVRALGQPAIDVLRDIQRQSNSTDYVLVGTIADYYSGWKGFKARLMERANIEGASAHTLRHSFASVGADLGLADSTIGTLLGHASKGVTSGYIHRLDATLSAAADRVAREVHRQMKGETVSDVVTFPGAKAL